MAILIVNAVLAAIVPPFLGLVNFAEGIWSVVGMAPMGAGLQEPVVICFPLVMGRLGTVKQKLMKLLVDVKEATWPLNIFYFMSSYVDVK